jgi:hypothetical protein
MNKLLTISISNTYYFIILIRVEALDSSYNLVLTRLLLVKNIDNSLSKIEYRII